MDNCIRRYTECLQSPWRGPHALLRGWRAQAKPVQPYRPHRGRGSHVPQPRTPACARPDSVPSSCCSNAVLQYPLCYCGQLAACCRAETARTDPGSSRAINAVTQYHINYCITALLHYCSTSSLPRPARTMWPHVACLPGARCPGEPGADRPSPQARPWRRRPSVPSPAVPLIGRMHLAGAGFRGPREAVLLRSPQFQCAHGAPACCNYLR